jgi:hypothetical protein
MLEEIIDHSALLGSSVKAGDLERAFEDFNKKTDRLARAEAKAQAAIDDETSRTDYHE